MLQQMLKMLPSWPNALEITAEDVAYSAFLGRKSASSVRQTVFSWQSDIPSQSDKRSSAGNLISPLSQTNGLQLAI